MVVKPQFDSPDTSVSSSTQAINLPDPSFYVVLATKIDNPPSPTENIESSTSSLSSKAIDNQRALAVRTAQSEGTLIERLKQVQGQLHSPSQTVKQRTAYVQELQDIHHSCKQSFAETTTHINASLALANLYMEGIPSNMPPFDNSTQEALQLCQQAADMGDNIHGGANYFLGKFFVDKSKISKNTNEQKRFLENAKKHLEKSLEKARTSGSNHCGAQLTYTYVDMVLANRSIKEN